MRIAAFAVRSISLMPKTTVHQHSSFMSAANAALERLLRVFAYYLIPVGIGAFSLVALLFWHNQYQISEPEPLAARFLVQRTERHGLPPQRALGPTTYIPRGSCAPPR